MDHKFEWALRFPGEHFLQYRTLARNPALIAINYFHNSTEVVHCFYHCKHLAYLLNCELDLLLIIPFLMQQDQ